MNDYIPFSNDKSQTNNYLKNSLKESLIKLFSNSSQNSTNIKDLKHYFNKLSQHLIFTNKDSSEIKIVNVNNQRSAGWRNVLTMSVYQNINLYSH
jgi:hypothetical protein